VTRGEGWVGNKELGHENRHRGRVTRSLVMKIAAAGGKDLASHHMSSSCLFELHYRCNLRLSCSIFHSLIHILRSAPQDQLKAKVLGLCTKFPCAKSGHLSIRNMKSGGSKMGKVGIGREDDE
jgi:hypothetical protein